MKTSVKTLIHFGALALLLLPFPCFAVGQQRKDGSSGDPLWWTFGDTWNAPAQVTLAPAEPEGSVTIIITSWDWIGSGDWFTDSNWYEGTIAGAFGQPVPDPFTPVYFGPGLLTVNGVPAGYIMPAGGAVMGASFSSPLLDMASWDGPSILTTNNDATYTVQTATVGRKVAPAHQYVSTGPIQSAVVNLHSGHLAGSWIFGSDEAGTLNVEETSSATSLTFGNSADGTGTLNIASGAHFNTDSISFGSGISTINNHGDFKFGSWSGIPTDFNNYSGGKFTIGSSAILSNTVTNQGLITFAGSTLNSEILYFSGATTLNGGGEIKLVNANSQIANYNSGVLTNVDNLIHGGGAISNTVDNQSIIRADNGVLNLSGAITDSAAGRIEVYGGSTLAFSSTITRGTLAGQAGSFLSGNGTLDGVTLTGTNTSKSSYIILQNTITNQGLLTFAPSSFSAETLYINGGVTLTGGGEVKLTDNNSQIANYSNGVLTNVDNLIHGGGGTTIGVAVNNQSTIRADYNAFNLTGAVTNTSTGRVEVQNGATLTFNSISGGTLALAAGAAVQSGGTLSGVTLTGTYGLSGSLILQNTLTNQGVLDFSTGSAANRYLYINGAVSLDGGGEVKLEDTYSNVSAYSGDAVLTNVNNLIHGGGGIFVPINNKGIVQADNGVLNLSATVTNTASGAVKVLAGATLAGGSVKGGTLNVETGAALSAVAVQQSTITGGEARFTGSLEGVTNSASVDVGNGSLILQNTITNQGLITFIGGSATNRYLYVNGAVTLTGAGEVNLVDSYSNVGNYSGDAVLTNVNNLIHGGGGATIGTAITNQSVIRADNGVLHLGAAITNSGAGAKVEVLNGATLDLGGTTLNGLVNVTAGEFIHGGTLNNVTSPGTITVDGSLLVLQNTITNQGLMTFQSGSAANRYLYVNGAVMLTGGGELGLVDSYSNLGSYSGDAVLTNVNNLIHGGGGATIGTAITNQSVIRADDGALHLGAAITNSGAGAKVEVLNGATLDLGGTTLNGLVNVTAGGFIHGGTLNNVTSPGTITVDGSLLVLQNTFTNQCLMTFQSGNAANRYLYVSGAMTLTGSGELKLVDSYSNLGSYTGDAVVTNVNNLIHGGGGATVATAIVNQGIFRADNGVLNVSSSVTNTGNGRVEVTNGGRLISSAALTNTGAGTVEITNGSRLTLTGAFLQNQQTATTILSGGAINSAQALNFAAGTLSGSGTINADVLMDGKLSPGASPGAITVNGALTLQSDATFYLEIGGLAAGTQFDHVDINGTLTLGGMLTLAMLNGFEALLNGSSTFSLANSNLPIAGAFTNAANGTRLTTSDGLASFVVNYGASSNYDPANLVLSNGVRIVPEPSDWALLFDGLGVVLGLQCWRKSKITKSRA